ncbi:Phage terminase, endonuclease subunit [Citrobacter portucalensis]|nr:Phage terminase, endonuclease subunit [Citrobacter portucalensis]
MALSPAQRHSQRIAMEQKLKRSQALETTESMHLLIKALETDVEHARNLPTIADRVEFKRDVLLPRWTPTVEAYLESGQVYANPVFAWCVIWLFDVGDLDKALDWADIAISQQQATPDRLRSNFPTFVADTMLAWAQETSGAGKVLNRISPAHLSVSPVPGGCMNRSRPSGSSLRGWSCCTAKMARQRPRVWMISKRWRKPIDCWPRQKNTI